MVSSSSMARSNVSFGMSALPASAMMCLRCGRNEPDRLSLISTAHQRDDVGGCRFRQAFKIIAAFEDGDDAPLRGLVGDIHDLAGRPGEVLLDELQVGEGVALVGVEARRDD